MTQSRSPVRACQPTHLLHFEPLSPQAAGLDFGQAQWQLNHQPFSPDPALSLAQNGVTHKAMLTLRVPGLDGIAGGVV